jgi:hypothetical protein
MAKVYGPLHSDDARGKLANALVFLGWKGIKTVRQWLKPANPKTPDQGDIRLILGGLGRATRAIKIGSAYHRDAVAVAGPQQTFVSAIVSFIIKNWLKNGSDFDTEYNEFASHSAESTFNSKAAELGLYDFDISYKGTAYHFPAGMMLYELAKYAIARKDVASGVFYRAPYTTELASWTATQINAFVTDLQSV